MKRLFLTLFLASLCCMLSAQELDSTAVYQLSEAVVKGVKVQENAPYAVANVKGSELRNFSKSGLELPFLLSRTPGVLAWSENGVGTGTSYMRIRGAADSRINVTLDGVPLNSPEDQCVFWANMNSYASLMDGVQIQRGVGTSTNGDGAFGGTVAMQTRGASLDPTAELNFSYGSYNTFNYGVSASSGLLWKHFVVDGAFHETRTDGFVHGTAGHSGSFYGGITYIGNNFIIKYKNIGNYEHTGQAWNGVTAGNDDLSLMDGTYGEKTGIKTYSDLYKRGLGRFNSLYEALQTDDDGNFITDAKGNYQTSRYSLKDGSLWPKTTDNFIQDHNILSASVRISDRWTTALSLHYTKGHGYYEEFRPNNKLTKFGLSFVDPATGKNLKRTDFVRQKGLTQRAGGFVWNINYQSTRWDVVGGVSYQRFGGNHYGYLTYVANDALSSQILSKDGRYQYYDSDAKKGDMSAFVKAAVHLNKYWDLFADLQYRHVSYSTDGINDKFLTDAAGNIVNQRLDVNAKHDFFNPKLGISYNKGGHHAYFSAALSHREPERNNYTDNGSYPAPKPESLLDYELGYQYTGSCWNVGVNLYYMDYKDQFVQTGAVSDIGEALTTNIKRSYREGVELTAAWEPLRWLRVEGNAALSCNKIKDFDEVVEDWDLGDRTIHYDNSTLAFSPSSIVNLFADFHVAGFSAVWHTAFVSRQYLDNTECKDRSLPSYSRTDLNFSYTLNLKGALKNIVFGVNVGNLFNSHYATSGWVYSAICDSYGHPNDSRYYQIGLVPAAGITAMGSLSLKF